MALSTTYTWRPSPTYQRILSPTTDLIRSALAETSCRTLELVGTGTVELDKDLLIPRPMRFIVPHGMTLKFADSITDDYGMLGRLAASEEPYYIGLLNLRSAASGTVMELMGTIDTNFDNTYDDANDIFTTGILTKTCHRLQIDGEWQAVNCRDAAFFIDGDDIRFAGMHYHTPTTAVAAAGVAGFGTEGCHRFHGHNLKVVGAYEGFDLNNFNRHVRFDNCYFEGHATAAGSKCEANNIAGLAFYDCEFVDVAIEMEVGQSEPRLSDRANQTNTGRYNHLIVKGCSMAITKDLSAEVDVDRPLFWTERQRIDALDIDLTVELGAAQTSTALFRIEDVPAVSDNVQNANIRLNVYGPTVALAQPVLLTEPTLDNTDIRMSVTASSSDSPLISCGKLRNSRIIGDADLGSFTGSQLVQLDLIFGHNEIALTPRLSAANSAAVIVNSSDASPEGFVTVKTPWELQQSDFYEFRSLVDRNDDYVVTTERFSDFIRTESPSMWIRDGVIEGVSVTAKTDIGDGTTQAQPGFCLCSPAGAVTFDSSIGAHHFGDNGDIGTGDFTLLGIIGGVPTADYNNDATGVISKGRNSGGGNAKYEVYLRDANFNGLRGVLGAAISDGTTTVAVSASNDNNRIDDQRGHLYMLRRSGDNLTLWVDGVYVATNSGASGLDLTNSENLLVGARRDSSGNTLNYMGAHGTGVWIGQHCIIDRALSGDEFAVLWQLLHGRQNF